MYIHVYFTFKIFCTEMCASCATDWAKDNSIYMTAFHTLVEFL